MLVDVPIFLAASLSVGVFYICAQRDLHPKTWHKEILYLPVLLALGIGLALNNARAVLEAVFNHETAFMRTPKYGIEKKTQTWKSSRYTSIKTLLPLAELLFAGYFGFVLAKTALLGQYFSIPFLLMFFGGFAWVAFSSLSQSLPRFSSAREENIDKSAEANPA